MSRKANLDSLFGSRAAPKPKEAQAEQFAAANTPDAKPEFADANTPSPPPKGRSSAVRTMGTTLRGLTARADAAADVESGSAIVEIAPELIDDSFIADRVEDAHDPTLPALVESIRESGQQVPVLVRPKPESPGRYQIAYGRRRTRAASILGRRVRAVVRPLSDDELVVAQGKENLERRDLSYIERAFFALRLEAHGFRRETITAAMGVGKGDLSTLISVARAVPEEVVSAIGPAPSAGRPRWMLLADRIKAISAGEISSLIDDSAFQAKPTDERFVAVLNAFLPKREPKAKAQIWKDPEGRKVARVERSGDRFILSIDEKLQPGLGAAVLDRLPEILAALRAGKE
ncbi:plasmid partitioning protein RepB [Methylobacterium oxalidis]|uniref:plasmid partitioning protein RepB n=1 Tax=Methylobacterium oxalidis TaxID=944322 RepID=UPI003315B702